MPPEPKPAGPNPKRVAAGRLNRAKRGPLTAAGRRRLREAALENQPWLSSTGPRTAAGKATVAGNGKVRQKGATSVREARRLAAGLAGLVAELAETRAALARSGR